MKRNIILALLGGFLVVARSTAQQAGSLDTNYVAVAGTDVAPIRLAPLPDGRLYVGGQFTNYGGAGKAAVARLLANGQVDASFTLPPLRQINPAIILNGQVLLPASTNVGQLSGLLALPDGRAVIAGSFTDIGGTPARRLALLAADGTPAVTSFAIGDLEPQAFALLAGPAGTFYVGNKGNVASGRLPLLRFKVDGSLDATFTAPLLTALGYQSANPFTLLRGPGDTIYAITAAAVGGAPASDILRLTSSGALDTSFAGTGKANIPFANFSSFVTDASGLMTFTGVTSYRGGALTRKINRLTLEGDLDATYQSSVDPGFGGRVVAAQADGKVLYTGGQKPINRLNADGTVDTTYANPAQVPVAQIALSMTQFVLAPDGSLFAVGFRLSPTFTVLNSAFHIFGDPVGAPPTIGVDPVAQTNTLGARTRFFVIAQGSPPFTYQWFRNGAAIPGATDANLILEPATAADADKDYHCVVSNAHGSAPSAAARLTLLDATPGSVYRETDSPTGPNAQVEDLKWDAAGRLVAGGGFTTWNGTNRIRLVRLSADGRTVDSTFDTSTLNGQLQIFDNLLPLGDSRLLGRGNLSIDYAGKTHEGVLRLNANGTLDTTFNVAGTGSSGTSAFRFAEGPAGQAVFFSQSWNDEAVASYLRIKADGTRDSAFVLRGAAYFSSGGPVVALPDGRYLVVGQRTQPGGVVRSSGVLRLKADGTPDDTFFTGQVAADFRNQSVSDLVRQPDGKILVAGMFTVDETTGGLSLGVIRLLPDGQIDRTFNPVPRLASLSQGLKLALQADGRILVVGVAIGAERFPRNSLFRLWPNGVFDPSFQVGVNSNNFGDRFLRTVAVNPANQIFVGGYFLEFAGLPRTNFARLNGGALQPVPAPPSLASVPARVVAAAGTNLTLTVVPGGDGPFQYQWRRNLQTGSSQFADVIGATNASLNLANLRVEDSGLFQVAVVNPGGAVFSAYIPLLVEPNPVVLGTSDRSWAAQDFLRGVSAVIPDGMLYGARGNGVTRHFEDGTTDLSFVSPTDLVRPDNFVDNGITALLRQPDGKLLIAGRLSTDGGPCNVPGSTCFEPKRGLVRLLPDGSYDPDFIQTNSFSGDAQLKPGLLLRQADGKIVVGGTFQNFSGRTATGLVRFGANGAFDDSFVVNMESDLTNPLRTLPGTATVLLPLSDGRFYVGGGFTKVQGVVRSGVARLNANGSLDAGFVPPTMANVSLGQAGSLTIYGVGPVTPAGGIYIFGRFQLVANGPIYAALRLRADGSVDDTFRVTTDFAINTGVVQADGKLIITGQFTKLNGQARGGFARLNGDGSTDASFTQGASFGVGAPMTILADGKLLIGGTRYFTGGDVEVAAPELDFTLTPGGLELTWPPGFQLQRTTSLSPASWQNVANPSPFTVPTSGPGEFYRVVPAP